jgi:hypothetical protein
MQDAVLGVKDDFCKRRKRAMGSFLACRTQCMVIRMIFAREAKNKKDN